MALIQRGPSRKKQIQLAATLLGIIGLTAAVAYYGIFKGAGSSAPPPPLEDPVIRQVSRVPAVSGIEELEALSKKPLFEDLRRFGTWPLAFQPKGRSQPFIIPQK